MRQEILLLLGGTKEKDDGDGEPKKSIIIVPDYKTVLTGICDGC